MIFIIIILIIIALLITLKYRNKKYEQFVLEHSILLANVRRINEKYKFKEVHKLKLTHRYDNEVFYNEISPSDYLTYQLVYIKKSVKSAMRDTLDNCNKFDFYSHELDELDFQCQFDAECPFHDKRKLFRTEIKLYKQLVQEPTISYTIEVELIQTNIKGKVLDEKYDIICADEIESVIKRLENKRGDFYLDREIWEAICRVERGKVSNKMRFAIYKRDNYRCQKCGRQNVELEIDHIYPIAKGGKTTIDNLQTLCKRCNKAKSDKIE